MNDRFLEDLKDRTDLVALISKYAVVKKAGKNYSCKSPFRAEKTPSFSISPDRGLWYDFGASEGGDAIRFLEKIENLSFREAVEHLAGVNNLPVPASFGTENTAKKEQKQGLTELHDAACTYFQEQLQQSKTAMEYLRNRGMTDDIMNQWRLGYGGDDSSGMTKHLLSKGFKPRQIEESGVSYTRSYGDQALQDRFHKRIMTPIFEPREGKIIAFSGRILPGSDQKGKYVNSPENPLYVKSKTLFGLHAARKPMLDRGEALIVEGNFDVISAHQAQINWCVATCGTALTDEHIRMLKRLCQRITLAFDTDAAGKKATLRALELLIPTGLAVRILQIPEGKDIDELAQKDPETLQKVVKESVHALEFCADQFAKKVLDGTLEREQMYLRHLFGYLRLSPSPLEIEAILTRVAGILNRPKDVIAAELERYKSNHKPPKAKFVAPNNIAPQTDEEYLVGLLAQFPDVLTAHGSAVLESLTEESPRQILGHMLEKTMTEDEKVTLTSYELRVPDTTPKAANEAIEEYLARKDRTQTRHSRSSDDVKRFYAEAEKHGTVQGDETI